MVLLAMTVVTVVQLVGALLGIAVLVGAAVVVVLRSTKNEMLADLTARVAQLKEERDDERSAHTATTASLQGRIDTLEGDFVQRIVAAVVAAVQQAKRGTSRG